MRAPLFSPVEGEDASPITFSDNCTSLTLLPAPSLDMSLCQCQDLNNVGLGLMSPRKRFTIYDSLNQSGVLGFGFNPKLEIRNARAKSRLRAHWLYACWRGGHVPGF
jgi:hypothetical protein